MSLVAAFVDNRRRRFACEQGRVSRQTPSVRARAQLRCHAARLRACLFVMAKIASELRHEVGNLVVLDLVEQRTMTDLESSAARVRLPRVFWRARRIRISSMAADVFFTESSPVAS